MPSITQSLMDKGLATSAPPWLGANVHYETIMGSHAYGVADTSVKSRLPDYDVYGFAIPPKEYIFPQSVGKILAFGEKPGHVITFGEHRKGWEQWFKHHMIDQDAVGGNGKEYDVTIFNIVKFFELCRQNNPNMIDSLFTPENCIIHCTQIGRMVRDQRRLFLSKECWVKFRGYAHSQLHKMETKDPEGDRREIVEKFGYDVKFAYHLIRLFDECEQILTEGDLDLQRAKEVMKAIRRGEWTEQDVRKWVAEKERGLETVFSNCKLPDKPPEDKLLQLLFRCLEEHYGSLDKTVEQMGWEKQALKDIDELLNKYRSKLYS